MNYGRFVQCQPRSEIRSTLYGSRKATPSKSSPPKSLLNSEQRGYIWELENKNPPRPSADKVLKIAAALGVTADFLLDTSNASKVEDATDQAFFRKYREMDDATKEKIRAMVQLWGDDK